MKEYRDLTISGSREALLATVSEIEKLLNDGWSRDKQTEEKNPRLTPDDLMFCFTCSPTTSRKSGHLVMQITSKVRDGNLWLSNIVPNGRGRLTHDEFNYIFEEFLQKFVRPAASKTGVTVIPSSGVVTIDDWFKKPTADKLRRFLALSHGDRSHWCDDERWMAFVVAARREGAKVNGDDLRRWLEEDAQCDHFWAEELAQDYQRFLEIRKFEEQLQEA